MSNEDVITLALHRYAHAKSVAIALRKSVQELINQGDLQGFTIHEFAPPVDASVQGFDLAFTDRRIRLVISGSNMQNGSVAIECWRIPLAYGTTLTNITVLHVSSDGEVVIPPRRNSYMIEQPGTAFKLVCHLVELVNDQPAIVIP